MAELPTPQALEAMTRAQLLVTTYDALSATHASTTPGKTHPRERKFHCEYQGRRVDGASDALAYSYSDTCTREFMDTSGVTHSTAKRTTNLTNCRNPPPIAATVYGSPYRSRAIPTTSFTTAAPWEIPTTYSRPLCRAISVVDPIIDPRTIHMEITMPPPVQALSSNTTLTNKGSPFGAHPHSNLRSFPPEDTLPDPWRTNDRHFDQYRHHQHPHMRGTGTDTSNQRGEAHTHLRSYAGAHAKRSDPSFLT